MSSLPTLLLPSYCMDAVKTHKRHPRRINEDTAWATGAVIHFECHQRVVQQMRKRLQKPIKSPNPRDKHRRCRRNQVPSLTKHCFLSLPLSVVTKRWGEFSATNESWRYYVRGKSNTAQPVRTWLCKQRVSAPSQCVDASPQSEDWYLERYLITSCALEQGTDLLTALGRA